MDLKYKIDRILEKYPTLSAADRATAVNDILSSVTEFVKQNSKSNNSSADYNSNPSIADLEEFLVAVRELQEKLDSQTHKTTQDVIRIDELRQLEYKITELIIANK